MEPRADSECFSARGWAGLLLTMLVLLLPPPTEAQEPGPRDYWFEVPALNRGLGPAPENLDRTSPQGTLHSFLEAAKAEAWDQAAHLLDLTGVDPARQPEWGPVLARQLASVIERKIWIGWDDLSDRPDAVVETGAGENTRIGQPRRSQRLGMLEIEGRPVVIRLNRLKPEGGDPVWVFARSTVDRVPGLYDAYGPGWLERRMPESWNAQVGGTPLRRWEFAGLPLYIAAAGVLFWLLRTLFTWLAQKAPVEMVRNASARAGTPVALALAACAALIGMGWVVTFSSRITTVATPILWALAIIGVTLATLRATDAVLEVIIRRYVGEISDQRSRDERQLYTSIFAFRRIVLLIAVLLGTGLLLMELRLGAYVGISLLASAGVLTVLLGVAGRSVLGNILASLQIAISKPIRIGDSVMYEERWAYVDAIFYTFVRLRTWDNRRFIVPVTYFVRNPFENLSMQEAKMTRTFELVLDHRADAEAVREAFMKIAAEDEDAMQGEMTKMLVIDHDYTGQRLLFYATAPDPTASCNMHARLREKMIGWVNEHHPEWWPRAREVEFRGGGAEARTDASEGAR